MNDRIELARVSSPTYRENYKKFLLFKDKLQSDSSLFMLSINFILAIVTKFYSLKFCVDYFKMCDARRYMKLGDYKESFIGSEKFTESFIAFYMEK